MEKKGVYFKLNNNLIDTLVVKTDSKNKTEAMEFAINYTLANYKNELSESKDLAIRKVVEKIALENYNVLLDKYNQLKGMYAKLLDVVLDLNDNVHELQKLKKTDK